MNYRYNVSCCETTSKIWTPSSIDCYKPCCRCSACNLHKAYFENSIFKCKMKETVIELVRKLGAPNIIEEEGVEDE